MAKILISYLRKSDKTPFGVIVATSPDNIGVAFHYPKEKFNKHFLKTFAAGRAVTNEVVAIPHVKGVPHTKDFVLQEIEKMKERARVYFKTDKNIEISCSDKNGWYAAYNIDESAAYSKWRYFRKDGSWQHTAWSNRADNSYFKTREELINKLKSCGYRVE
jgi:hypothetical protein